VWGPSRATSFVLLEEVAMRNREVLKRTFWLVVLLRSPSDVGTYDFNK
jgi:hypothetical protein